MKRLVLILPSIFGIGFVCTADQDNGANQNVPVVQVPLPDPNPIVFEKECFFEMHGQAMYPNFVKWIRGEDCGLGKELSKEIKKYPSILPTVELSGFEDTNIAAAVKNNNRKYILKTISTVTGDFSQHPVFKKKLENVTASIDPKGKVFLKIGNPKANSGTVTYVEKTESLEHHKAKSLLMDYNRAWLWVGTDNGSIHPFDLVSNQYVKDKVLRSQVAAIKALGLIDGDKILVSWSDDKLCFSDIKTLTCRTFIDTQKMPSFSNIYASEKNVVFSKAVKGTLYNGPLCFQVPVCYIKNTAFDTKNGAFFMFGLYLAMKDHFEKSNNEKQGENVVTASEVLNNLYNSDVLRSYNEKSIQPVIKEMIKIKAKDYGVDLREII